MVRKSLIRIASLLAAILFFSCQHEKFTEKGIPEVETLGVTLLQDGVTFHGEVLSDADTEITDHGFTWVPSSNRNPSEVQFYSLGPLKRDIRFNATINSTIEKDREYVVRAYIIAGAITSFGNEVTFSGIGSKPSELVSVTPASAQIGDTVVIRGSYFSNNPESCKVYFGNTGAVIVSSNINELKVVVPLVKEPSVDVRVAVTGIFSSNTISFNILLPVLTEIIPASAASGDTVVIRGNYFTENIAVCSVFFGHHRALVLSSTINEIRVIVPYMPQTSASVYVVINEVTSTNKINFGILRPVLLGIEPMSGTFGDTISIHGDYFPADPSFIEVFFNNVKAVVTEASRFLLKVKVPDGNNISPVTITVRYYDVYTWVDKFVLNQAEVDDVSPKFLERWEPLVISGRNFNPDPEMNIVEIGGQNATVISSTGSEIHVNLPSGLRSGSYQVVVTTIEGAPVTWNGYLVFKTNWAKMASFPSTGRVGGAGFSIGGKIYFGTGLTDMTITRDFWEYNPEMDRWSSKSSYPEYISYATGLSMDGMGFFAIGKNASRYYTDMIRYDPVNNLWKRMALMPGEGSSMDSPGFVINGKAYVPAGGHMYVYNPANNTWAEKSFPPDLGYFGGGVVFSINGKGYLGVGWVHDKGVNVSDFFEYDPVADSWTRKASFPGTLRNNATSFSLPNGRGYVGMGYSNVLGEYLDDIWEYDPQADKWMQTDVFPGAPRFGARAYVIGNDAFILTGGHAGIYEQDVWRFSPLE